MKLAEQQFMVAILERKYEQQETQPWQYASGVVYHLPISVRDIANDLEVPYKQLMYYLSKWTYKDWYEYGVCLDLGWFTNIGLEKAKEVKAKLQDKE